MSALPNSASGRILVVDDEEPVARLLEQWLTDEGHDARYALGLAQARAFLDTEPFDLVTLDIMMPQVNGLEGLQWVVDQHPEVAVLMVTAIDTVSTVIQAMRAGAVGYLIKPLNLDLVSQDIARAMERQRLLGENRAHRLELEQRVQAQAHQLRVAIELLEDRERELQARDELAKIQMCPAGERDRLHEQVTRIVARALRASQVVVYRPDHVGQNLVPVGALGAVHRDQRDYQVNRIDLHPVPMGSPDSLVAQVFSRAQPASGEWGKIAAPILYNTETLGVLWAGGRSDPGKDDTVALAGLGREVALLLRIAEIMTSLEEEKHEMAQALGAATAADAPLAAAVESDLLPSACAELG